MDKEHATTPADQSLYLTMCTVEVLGAIQQAYTDGKIIDLESYNTLYELARTADGQARKLLDMLEHSKGSHTPTTEEMLRQMIEEEGKQYREERGYVYADTIMIGLKSFLIGSATNIIQLRVHAACTGTADKIEWGRIL